MGLIEFEGLVEYHTNYVPSRYFPGSSHRGNTYKSSINNAISSINELTIMGGRSAPLGSRSVALDRSVCAGYATFCAIEVCGG
jgi:hypothetical protein